MMATDDKSQKTSKNQTNTRVSSEEEKGKEKIKEEGVVKENPDVDDPRLYSPLQEPGRPDPIERTSEEKKDSEDSQD
jgi:hypothetical protein